MAGSLRESLPAQPDWPRIGVRDGVEPIDVSGCCIGRRTDRPRSEDVEAQQVEATRRPGPAADPALSVDFFLTGQGWRGGFYFTSGARPLLGPFESEQEAEDSRLCSNR